eukprot:CAMPEP_0183395158 /NCGR_PEP_ID=MMETSP0370-20130417/9110_1 /TAXON_ID=268820 /ORGANISM="Peridinium aciculiferum, Strain PAER-2" /LENGTH=102 /DNA_ID=CAMNT_0025575701 /DNA_START=239 /DNA_END=543 /DNA_ORIENTATION=+
MQHNSGSTIHRSKVKGLALFLGTRPAAIFANTPLEIPDLCRASSSSSVHKRADDIWHPLLRARLEAHLLNLAICLLGLRAAVQSQRRLPAEAPDGQKLAGPL